MDSRNRTQRNDKQEELIKRLEEIRMQRDTAQTTVRQSKEIPSERRNQNQQPRQQRDKRAQSNRNQNQQREMQRRNTQTTRPKTIQDPTPTDEIKTKTDRYFRESEISQKEIHDNIRKQDLTQRKTSTKKNQSKPLIDQLSSSDNLAQAIILNEILSKPIALRYKNR